jgi:hypothetical protein
MWRLGKTLERCTFLEFKDAPPFFNRKKCVKYASYIRSNVVYIYVCVCVRVYDLPSTKFHPWFIRYFHQTENVKNIFARPQGF